MCNVIHTLYYYVVQHVDVWRLSLTWHHLDDNSSHRARFWKLGPVRRDSNVKYYRSFNKAIWNVAHFSHRPKNLWSILFFALLVSPQFIPSYLRFADSIDCSLSIVDLYLNVCMLQLCTGPSSLFAPIFISIVLCLVVVVVGAWRLTRSVHSIKMWSNVTFIDLIKKPHAI